MRDPNTVLEPVAWIKKITAWLEGSAKRSRQQGDDSNFETLTEACYHDAKNYAAMAKDGRAVLAKAKG